MFDLIKKRKRSFLFLLFLLLAIPVSVYLVKQVQEYREKAASKPPKAETVPGQVVVKFRAGSAQDGALRSLSQEEGEGNGVGLEEIKQKYKVTEAKPVRISPPQKKEINSLAVEEVEDNRVIRDVSVFSYTSGASPEEFSNELKKLSQVEWAEPVFIYRTATTITPTPTATYVCGTNDPRACDGSQWALNKVNASGAWQLETGSNSVVVAVLDTGVEATHEDLKDNMTGGMDIVNNDQDPSDGHGHGTHVAGILGAVANNGIGMAGLNWDVSIMPVKILSDEGFGYSTDLASGIYYATLFGADIINMSLQGYGDSELLREAINSAHIEGVTLVAAAGNSYGPADYVFPGAFEHVIGVGATDSQDLHAAFSNYGPTVDISAPGVDIYSTYMGNSYDSLSGTSMASPYVAGLAALILAKDPSLTPNEVEAIIQNSASDLGEGGWDKYFGWGRINAREALQYMEKSPLPYAVWTSPEDNTVSPKQVILTGIANGEYVTFEHSEDSGNTWSTEGLLISNQKQTDLGQEYTVTYTAPDDYNDVLYFKVTAVRGAKRRSSVLRVSVDSTSRQIDLPFTSYPYRLDVSDVNDDGKDDIFAASNYELYLFNEDGSVHTGWPIRYNTEKFLGEVAVGDIDTSYPGLEVVVVYNDYYDQTTGGSIHAWHADGTTVKGWPRTDMRYYGMLALADLDNNNSMEVLYLYQTEDYSRSVLHVFDGAGSKLPGFPVEVPEVWGGINIADWNGDKKPEIVLNYLEREDASKPYEYNYKYYQTIINQQGKTLPGYPQQTSEVLTHRYSVTGDIDLDGKDELVSYVQKSNGGENLDTYLEIRRESGVTTGSLLGLTGWPSVSLILADVVGDSKPEILMNAGSYSAGEKLYIFDKSLKEIQSPISHSLVYSWVMLAKKTPGGSEVYLRGDEKGSFSGRLLTFASDGSKLKLSGSKLLPEGVYQFSGSTSSNNLYMLSNQDSGKAKLIVQPKQSGRWEWREPDYDSSLSNRYISASEINPTDPPTPTNSPTPTVTGTPTPTNIPTPKPPAKDGDTNGDKVVDIYDFSNVVEAYGSRAPDNPADLDQDGDVDIFDFNKVIENFGRILSKLLHFVTG